MFKVNLDQGNIVLFAFRYSKEPFPVAEGETEVTTCYIRQPGENGKVISQSTIRRNYRDVFSREVARKESLTRALMMTPYTRDQRRLFWERYLARNQKSDVNFAEGSSEA